MVLQPGWNSVYIESTPENPSCSDFFADVPQVLSVAAYRSDADADTAQYYANGEEIVQAPVQYLQWNRDGASTSTLKTIVGGGTYVIYATEEAQIQFRGVPAAPKMTWRKVSSSETNEYFNLVGVSSVGDKITFQDYFGEGPFGIAKSGRMICSMGGNDINGPEMRAVAGSFGKEATLKSGMAYALTATEAGSWPGVVGVLGSCIFFGPESNYASIRVQNCGTTNHVFKFSISASADETELVPPISRRLPRIDAISVPGYTNVTDGAWTVELAAGEHTDQVFSLDRSLLEAGKEYGAILTIEDLGPSKMRVRLPVVASPVQTDTAAYPTGLWVGEIALSLVSGIDDATPVPAGGKLKMNVMMHVDENKKCTLLQRVAFGADADGKPRLFKELESAETAGVANAKRFSTVMMSVDTPHVESAGGSAFGDTAEFAWTVAPDARDNPFRHAWHPDHDGKKADYSGAAPSGDNPSNYANPVKPELWSINNHLTFSWHEGGSGANPVNFEYNADEATAGIVIWDVSGLAAKGPIRSVGTFVLKRVLKAKELE
ncbi:MAG: hypothetical protein E7049_03665 [Lentisphaerae bacterium]|nr:hypothetical protein [Lentisphaerota bacterium]